MTSSCLGTRSGPSPPKQDSIGPRKNRAALRRLGAVHALPVAAFLLQRNTAHRRARFFLDLRFALGASAPERVRSEEDRKSTRLNSSHTVISYAVFCLKKKKYIRKKI